MSKREEIKIHSFRVVQAQVTWQTDVYLEFPNHDDAVSFLINGTPSEVIKRLDQGNGERLTIKAFRKRLVSRNPYPESRGPKDA